MKKALLYGGVVALILGGAWWLGHRAGARSKNPALGADGTGFATLDFIKDMPKLSAYAGAQALKAEAGDWLSDYRNAEGIRFFWQAPAYNVQAYYAAAFWTAVAARVLHSRTLGARADKLAAQGTIVFALPGSSLMKDSVMSIMKSAAADVKKAAGKDTQKVSAILAAMGELASPTAIANAQKRVEDQSWVAQGAWKTKEDIQAGGEKALEVAGSALDFVRAAAGMMNPKGGSYPWWMRWGPRIVLGTIAAIGLRLYFAPQYKAAKSAVLALRGPATSTPPRQITTTAPSSQQEAA